MNEEQTVEQKLIEETRVKITERQAERFKQTVESILRNISDDERTIEKAEKRIAESKERLNSLKVSDFKDTSGYPSLISIAQPMVIAGGALNSRMGYNVYS